MLAHLQGGVPRFETVHVVFAEEHATSLISSFGHLFVCLPEQPILTTADLLNATALNFGADLSPLGDGPWVGGYHLQPFHELARKNIRIEQRELVFFELALPPKMIADLRLDLERRLGESFRYDFFKHNCGQYLLDWLNGSDRDTPRTLYFTPREALGEILERFPPVHIRRLRSDLSLLEDQLEGAAGATRNLVAEGIMHPNVLLGVEDLVTRLLALKVAETKAHREEYDSIQVIRSMTLRQPSGVRAARRLVKIQTRAWDESVGAWSSEPQGPALSVDALFRTDRFGPGVQVQLEAGLQDPYSSPTRKKVLRDIHFLALTLQVAEDLEQADFVLASVDVQRDFSPLRKAPSAGLSMGYLGLPNTLGTTGLYMDMWGGVSVQYEGFWLGTRLTFIADGLQGRAHLTVAPGVTLGRRFGRWISSVKVDNSKNKGTGWFFQQEFDQSELVTLQASWTDSPLDQQFLTLGIHFRF